MTIETIWFWLVAVMIVGYVVLDGFDLGAGILHLVIAKTEEERRIILRAIGPVWDGNEVWLLAGGGTLFFAFPSLYASSFSGFYLPLMMVLWLLILRGIGIEFRTHYPSPVWRQLFDGLFSFSSALLAVFFGAAIGNIIRGVPLQPDGSFFEALWTNWRVSNDPGILDWYTVLTGVVSVTALTTHGALYLANKTSGELNARAVRAAKFSIGALALVTLLSLIATLMIRPELQDNYRRTPILYAIPALVAFALIAMALWNRQGAEKRAFIASCTYLVAMLVGAAAALYPNLLSSASDPSRNLTVYNAAAGHHSLTIGLIWWSFGMMIAIGYFVFLYRMFRGRVSLEASGHH